MGNIIPVPAGRTSELLIRHRLLANMSDNQASLLRLESQVSSGQRLFLPSDDAPAAMRAIGLQQLLDRKTQVRTNLDTNQSFLSATDSALSQVAGLLTDIRGTAQSVVGVTATDDQRLAAAEQVHQALVQLTNTANQQFRGRFLFAGSRSDTQPFELTGQAVEYRGNQNSLSSFADIGLLFPTNSDGDSVFGTLSTVVQGTVDLNPVLADQTRLADLHGGSGIRLGKIAVSDGTATSIVDLTGANTIGDVISLLEHNPPSGRAITAMLTSTGIDVQLDSIGGGSLTIKEFAGGATATDLGILRLTGAGVGPIVGENLNPRLTGSTPLDDMLGTRARATIVSPGDDNDLIIEARDNGAQLNGVAVSFVNDITMEAGQETATYDVNSKSLVFRINGGRSTLTDVIRALDNSPQAGALFRASASPHDTGNPTDPATTFVDATATAVLADGAGVALDRQSGVRITSGEKTYTIDISQARTVEDLLNKFNGSDAALFAEINATGTGINVRSRLSGLDFSIGENGGATATQLGIRSFTTDTRLEDLNHGAGVHALGAGKTDFVIQRKDGIKLSFDLSQATTVGDVLNLINNHPANQDPTYSVNARLATNGNGIEFYTASTSNVASLAVLKTTSSQAAQDLGLIAAGATQSQAAVINGAMESIAGRDVNPSEVDGAFTALVRLEKALRTNDQNGIGRAISVLDDSAARVTHARAELGARQQGLDTLRAGLDSEVTSLKSSLSLEVDTDLPTALSDLAGRQAAFQAALQTASAISRLSLLDFL